MPELDALDPVPDQVKLESGTVVCLEDLRSRQFFKFLRIITHAAMPAMQTLFRADVDAAEFGANLLTVTLLSIPDAEDEAIEFIRCMCKPVGLIEGRRRVLTKADHERNNALLSALDDELENPELEDTITIIEAVVRRESDDILALGKRLAAMFRMAEKTGQIPSSPHQTSTPQTLNFLADSPEPSTSSPASTDGPMTSSSTSPSDDSDNTSPPSENDASTSSGNESSGSSGRRARSPRS